MKYQQMALACVRLFWHTSRHCIRPQRCAERYHAYSINGPVLHTHWCNGPPTENVTDQHGKNLWKTPCLQTKSLFPSSRKTGHSIFQRASTLLPWYPVISIPSHVSMLWQWLTTGRSSQSRPTVNPSSGYIVLVDTAHNIALSSIENLARAWDSSTAIKIWLSPDPTPFWDSPTHSSACLVPMLCSPETWGK